MKKTINRIVSFLCVATICITTQPIAFASASVSEINGISQSVDASSTEAEYVMQEQIIDTTSDGSTYLEIFGMESYSGNGNLAVTLTDESNLHNYIRARLTDELLEWERDGVKSYSLSAAENLQISSKNISKLVEITEIGSTFYISYYNHSGEYVILEILENGTVLTYVSTSVQSGNIISEVIVYDSSSSEVKRNLFVKVEENALQESASTNSTTSNGTICEYTPVDFGFVDTGESGYTISTKQVYIEARGENLFSRVVGCQTNFSRKTSDGLVSFAINTAVTVVASTVFVPVATIRIVLSAYDILLIVIDGIQVIAEVVKLYKNPVYTAYCAQYGDISDPVYYSGQYCRVVFNTATLTYTYGQQSDSSYTFVRSQFPTMTNAYIHERVQYLYNSCLVAYGTNNMYYPA